MPYLVRNATKKVRHKHNWSNIIITDFSATLLLIYSLYFKLDSIKSYKSFQRRGELRLNSSGCLYNDLTGFHCGSIAVPLRFVPTTG